MASRPGDLSAAPRNAVFEQLDKVLASQPFQTSERSSRLLRFLIEQSVSARSERLKEYEIGTEALGKGPGFDPRMDPIVRSEVSRLRNRLEKYYTTAGQTDPLIILLPKGSYLPQVQTRSPQPTRSTSTREKELWGFRRLGTYAASVVTAACVVAIVLWSQSPRPSGPEDISIAVLPFANLSGDATQEFFSDGMTEELTTALARVPDLRVVGRTSAFQFKGRNQDLRAIGEALSATHLIEGSVRKDGNDVRITAQLIRADDGTHLWTESYNRELRGVFAIQEEIATAIASALRAPLGLQPGDALVRNRTNDPASYDDYLRAKALVRARGLKQLTEAGVLLEQVVARDPGYAPAWALLSLAYLLTPTFEPAWYSGSLAEARRIVDSTMPRAETAAQRAIELDPKSADGYVSLGYAQAMRTKLLESEELYLKALALDRYDPDALHLYSQTLASAGRLKDAVALRRQLRTLEPFVPVFNLVTADFLWGNGEADEALSLLNEVPAEFPLRQWQLALIYASLGRYGEAADMADALPQGMFLPGTVEDAARLLRTAPKPVDAPQDLPRLGLFSLVYFHIGAPDRALEFPEDGVALGYSVPNVVDNLWHPSHAPVRRTERFKRLVRDAGLVDYWRARGWPEFCRPTTDDDFACE